MVHTVQRLCGMQDLLCPPVYDVCCCISSVSFLIVSWYLGIQGFLLESVALFAAGTASCIHRGTRLLHGGVTNAILYVMDHIFAFSALCMGIWLWKCQRSSLFTAFLLFSVSRLFYDTLMGRLLHWSGHVVILCACLDRLLGGSCDVTSGASPTQ